MGSFTTNCPLIPNLNGTCVITGNQITSYDSTNLGPAKNINNTGSGSNLVVKLEFEVETNNPSPPPAKIKTKYKYDIGASPSGNNYSGGAGVDTGIEPGIDPVDPPDPWTATAIGEPVVAAKATS